MQQDKHIPALDGLRGLAIILILVFHFFIAGPLQPLIYFGQSGVELFFVLSGFLITGILLDTKDQPGYLRVFYARRALRILPLYYGVLLIFAIASSHFEQIAWFAQSQGWFWSYLQNFFFLKNGFQVPLGHFWSLAIEEQYYLFWPFAVLLFNRKWLTWVCIALIVTSITLRFINRDPMFAFCFPLARLDGLAIGSLIAVRKTFNKAGSLMLVSLIILALLIVFKIHPLKIFGLALFFGSLLMMVLNSENGRRVFSTPVLRFFGKYSYGMYVFNSIVYHVSNWMGAIHLSWFAKLSVHILGVLITIILSYLSYELYEKWFLKLKPAYKKSSVPSPVVN